jgi:hypothetical protein
MKAYIKGGLFSGPKHANPSVSAIIPAPSNSTPIRAVTLSQPITETPGMPATVESAFRPIVRGQKADEITITPIPKLEVGGKEGQPKPMPKDPAFTPPAPTPVTPGTPSPVYDSLGMTPDGCFDGAAGPYLGRNRYFSDSAGVGDRRQCWASGEYLMWWQRSQTVPPLVTTSDVGTSRVNAAVLGVPTTATVFDQTPNTTRGGGRFTLGTWLPHFCNRLGVDTTFFFLGRSNASATYASDGTTILGRPFVEGGVNSPFPASPRALRRSPTTANSGASTPTCAINGTAAPIAGSMSSVVIAT